MGKILFLGMPAYGHINPTLGIIDELVKQGEEVVYFCGDEFKETIESTGAVFKSYGEWSEKIAKILNDRKTTNQSNENVSFVTDAFEVFVGSCEKTVENILEQIKGIKFDSIGYSSVFPYCNIIAKILGIPSFSSFAIFATQEQVVSQENHESDKKKPVNYNMENNPIVNNYKEIAGRLNVKYNIEMPSLTALFFNRGDINFAYTSKDFVTNIEDYDNTYKFIGPPIYDRKEDVTDFPYKEIKGKKVIYISLGTVYSNFDKNLYAIFFKAFKDVDAVVVMTAYNVDLSEFDIPKNFIVKNYIAQAEILKYADVAVTHAGMNSTNDLLYNKIPFVAIPLGADQPYMASRVAELGACISLDKDKLTPELLRESVKKVLTNPQYLQNIKKIDESFRKCGGHKRAAKEILNLNIQK